jgi:hypothetical protein
MKNELFQDCVKLLEKALYFGGRLCSAGLRLRIGHLHDASAGAAGVRTVLETAILDDSYLCAAGLIDAAPDLPLE